jgi:hypothetical protein
MPLRASGARHRAVEARKRAIGQIRQKTTWDEFEAYMDSDRLRRER